MVLTCHFAFFRRLKSSSPSLRSYQYCFPTPRACHPWGFENTENSDSNYIGLSFVIKNLLIIIVTISYLYFYFFLGKAVKSIENLKDNIKKDNEPHRVDSLDHFLNEKEINKKN